MDESENQILMKFVHDLENFVLETEVLFSIISCPKCRKRFRTQQDEIQYQCPKCGGETEIIRDRQGLYDIEMAIESNRDYGAYFERYGEKITKFDIERRLNKIKMWVFTLIKEKSQKRRFKRFR